MLHGLRQSVGPSVQNHARVTRKIAVQLGIRYVQIQGAPIDAPIHQALARQSVKHLPSILSDVILTTQCGRPVLSRTVLSVSETRQESWNIASVLSLSEQLAQKESRCGVVDDHPTIAIRFLNLHEANLAQLPAIAGHREGQCARPFDHVVRAAQVQESTSWVFLIFPI